VDPIAVQVEAAVSDARRAAVNGAIGDAPDRSGVIVAEPTISLRRQITPSASPLSVAIDGPGMFVFESSAGRAYGRLGDFSVDDRGRLIDGRGRAVLGVASTTNAAPEASHLAPIRVERAMGFTDYSIDDRGVLSALANGERRSIGQVALAVFPAPERMKRLDDTSVVATHAAGDPHFYLPGAANVGALAPRSLENGLVDLDGDLARMWSLRRRGELEAAQAYASDGCERVALGLVK